MRLSGVIRKVRDTCPEDCTLCEDACAKKMSELGAVIKAENVHKVPLFKAITCFQCSKPACIEACPSEAIVKSEDGVVKVLSEKCVGCEACVSACTYGNMFFDSNKSVAFKCEMCGGYPECVKACPQGVLELFKGDSIQSYLSDEDFLARGTRACAGCPPELMLRLTLRVVGDNKDTVMFGCPGCATTMMIGSGSNASTRLPYVNCLFTSVPSTMTGVYEYYRHLGKKVNLVAFVGDGCVSDVSFQMLSGAAERGERIVVICYDNEGYMNTGIQRSSTTPFGSWTKTTPVGEKRRGKLQNSKYIPLLMVLHNVPYVATASPAYPEDYAKKLKKALKVEDGLSYIHLHAPCPTGWGFPPDLGIQVAQAAVETNYFPLWECEQGRLRITQEIKSPKVIGEFTKLMGRFSHLSGDELKGLQRLVDERLARIKLLASSTPNDKKVSSPV